MQASGSRLPEGNADSHAQDHKGGRDPQKAIDPPDMALSCAAHNQSGCMAGFHVPHASAGRPQFEQNRVLPRSNPICALRQTWWAGARWKLRPVWIIATARLRSGGESQIGCAVSRQRRHPALGSGQGTIRAVESKGCRLLSWRPRIVPCPVVSRRVCPTTERTARGRNVLDRYRDH